MENLTAILLPCFWASVACIGFGLVYNIHGFGILICGFGAGLGWLVYLLSQRLFGGDIFPAFVAAAAIALYAETMARLRRCPVTGYLQVALLPLVPGAGIYNAMGYCVAGEDDLFLSTLLHTFGFAASLAIGAMVSSTVLRIILHHLARKKAERAANHP